MTDCQQPGDYDGTIEWRRAPRGGGEARAGVTAGATVERAAEKEQIVVLLPSLRAFARSLTRSPAEADDLVQETLVRALGNLHQFMPGTNLKAWLFRIERNVFYTVYRKRHRETAALQREAEVIRTAPPQQEWWLKLGAVDEALDRLPGDQREALLLVGGTGLSYEEAADVCGCALGTIKSRVSRARSRLTDLLEVHHHDDFMQSDRQGV